MSEDGDSYVDSPLYDRNPSPPPELCGNKEEVHGDSIGETAFSKHWLFTTLMKLIQEVDKENESKVDQDNEFGVDVDEELQNELCKLWDMSMNAEVATFLQEFKALDILSGVIAKSKAPRVTEICVGILGNMACDKGICKTMSENDKFVKMMVMMIENPDPPTLVETTRLVYTCLSNKDASQSWINIVKSEPEFFTKICFVLHSSTNTDLLKNTGECVDVLLDQDEELCTSWATQELVESLLEAVKQIGYSHSETLETFMHIFQLLSTSEEGVAAMVVCADVLQIPLLKYLLSVCEDEIVGLEGHEGCLASALSVLNVLYSSSADVVDKLSSAPDLIRILLKILEPLFPLIPENRNKMKTLSSNSTSAATSSQDKTETDQNSRFTNSDENGDKKQVVDEEKMCEENTTNSAECESETVDIHKHKVLFSVLQGFLGDAIVSLVTDDDEDSSEETTPTPPLFISVLKYLNCACSRRRINYMLFSIEDVKHDSVDPTEHLYQLCGKYSQDRLGRIITDFREGNFIFRSDSINTEEKR